MEAFKQILKQGRKPDRLQTDKGSEFLNRTFQKFLKQQRIHFFVSQNEDIKASIVERFNRTLKEKLWRYFTYKNTLTYTGVLNDVVSSYNHSYHRSIKARPVDVNVSNQESVWQTLYASSDNKKKKKKKKKKEREEKRRLNAGDIIRISKSRRAFKKGYLPSWTEELFTVSRVQKTSPVTYVLKDASGEELEGSFYEEEIQKVGKKRVFRIENILNTRQKNKKRQYLVKWLGYPSSFNSWVFEEDIEKTT